MIALELGFPSGRFHATPWGRHVNEGVAEWPPSPWRILRAIVAVAKRAHDGPSNLDLQSLLRPLMAPPSFVLPDATVAHTRHYMPWGKKGPADRTLVFDTFVSVAPASSVLVVWPDVELSSQQRIMLSTILRQLNALGRAESWCDARVLDRETTESALPLINCRPADAGGAIDKPEPVRVLCADPESAFGNDCTPKAPQAGGRKVGRSKEVEPLYDPDWHLCIETMDLHKDRWSNVPGARWVTYERRSDCFRVRRRLTTANDSRCPTIARYALDCNVLPVVQSTLLLAERFRRAIMSSYRRVREEESGPAEPGSRHASEVFAGKDSDGRPLTDHRHAYYLPTDDDGDGRIDHITVVAERGFDATEVKALDRLRSLYLGPEERLGLLLVGLGAPHDLNAPLFRSSAEWVSATPFVATRHQKRRGRKRERPEHLGAENTPAFLAHLLREELDRRAQRQPEAARAEPLAIEPWDGVQHGRRLPRAFEFRRQRLKPGDDGGRRPFGFFRVRFAAPVAGPLCLGHSCHFGLGMFLPAGSGTT